MLATVKLGPARLATVKLRSTLVFGIIALGTAGFDGAPLLFAHPATGAILTSKSQSSANSMPKPGAESSDIPPRDSEFDSQAEQQILELANRSRQQAGAPPLKMDSGLTRAARVHAQAMLQAHQLSHQFEGEPALPQRLAAATSLQLDQEGENVALDVDPAQAEQHLMLSPPHRANLLNPAYNVVGIGVIHGRDRLYVVQDFGHALPNYSLAEVKDRIASAIIETRRHANALPLSRQDGPAEDLAACSMAHADKLTTPAVRDLAQHNTVLTFTSLRPETLPQEFGNTIAGRNLHSFSIGACFGRTATYPTGVYWVVLSLE